MNTSSFQTLSFSQIKDTNARNISLRQEPAIYAWFRSYDNLYNQNDADKLYKDITDMLNAKLSARFKGKLGYLYELQVQEISDALTPKKKALLKDMCRDRTERDELVHIINMASDFQSPLYVGKAINLRKRIGEHCEGQSALISRLEEAGIDLDRCFIKFKYINIPNNLYKRKQLDDKSVLIEEIITKLSPAAFVKRPG